MPIDAGSYGAISNNRLQKLFIAKTETEATSLRGWHGFLKLIHINTAGLQAKEANLKKMWSQIHSTQVVDPINSNMQIKNNNVERFVRFNNIRQMVNSGRKNINLSELSFKIEEELSNTGMTNTGYLQFKIEDTIIFQAQSKNGAEKPTIDEFVDSNRTIKANTSEDQIRNVYKEKLTQYEQKTKETILSWDKPKLQSQYSNISSNQNPQKQLSDSNETQRNSLCMRFSKSAQIKTEQIPLETEDIFHDALDHIPLETVDIFHDALDHIPLETGDIFHDALDHIPQHNQPKYNDIEEEDKLIIGNHKNLMGNSIKESLNTDIMDINSKFPMLMNNPKKDKQTFNNFQTGFFKISNQINQIGYKNLSEPIKQNYINLLARNIAARNAIYPLEKKGLLAFAARFTDVDAKARVIAQQLSEIILTLNTSIRDQYVEKYLEFYCAEAKETGDLNNPVSISNSTAFESFAAKMSALNYWMLQVSNQFTNVLKILPENIAIKGQTIATNTIEEYYIDAMEQKFLPRSDFELKDHKYHKDSRDQHVKNRKAFNERLNKR